MSFVINLASIGFDSLVGNSSKTTTAGCSEMLHVFDNCIKNFAPRTRERDPRVNECSGSFIGQAVALFYGVVE